MIIRIEMKFNFIAQIGFKTDKDFAQRILQFSKYENPASSA
jgi:hypothetical protein